MSTYSDSVVTKKCRKCEAPKTISFYAPKQWPIANPVCRECDRDRRVGSRETKSKEDYTRAFRTGMVIGVGNCSMKARDRRLAEAAERARRYTSS